VRGHSQRQILSALSAPETVSSIAVFELAGTSSFKPQTGDTTTIKLWGGGGSSAGCNALSGKRGGAAGGSYAQSALALSITTYAVVVAGTRNATANSGAKGNSSTFGGTMVVAEGGNGSGTADQFGGLGSVSASTGQTLRRGGNGANGDSTYSGGGGGGAGTTGNGGDCQTGGLYFGAGTSINGGNGGTARNSASSGQAGSNYGGGGSGAWRTSSGSYFGGNGAQGKAEIVFTAIKYQIPHNSTFNSNVWSMLHGSTVITSGSLVLTSAPANTMLARFTDKEVYPGQRIRLTATFVGITQYIFIVLGNAAGVFQSNITVTTFAVETGTLDFTYDVPKNLLGPMYLSVRGGVNISSGSLTNIGLEIVET